MPNTGAARNPDIEPDRAVEKRRCWCSNECVSARRGSVGVFVAGEVAHLASPARNGVHHAPNHLRTLVSRSGVPTDHGNILRPPFVANATRSARHLHIFFAQP